MQFNRIYNEKSFDSRHDIATSLTFSIFNPLTSCSGGITIAFYEDSLSSPYGGGPNGSLGYSPFTGYEGLKGAHLGIGLDISGEFSKKADGRNDGDYKNNPNTIAIRGPELNDYPLLTYTENLSSMFNIVLGQNYTNENDAIYTTIRVVLTEHGRLVKVQKMVAPDNFITLTQTYLDRKKQTSYRIACNFVSPDDTTVFKIKEFNCYGFEQNVDNILDTTLSTCVQFIQTNVFSTGQSTKLFLGSNNLFSEKAGNKSFNDYILTTSLTTPYDERQTINYNSSIIENFLDNSVDRLLVKNSINGSLDIYRNLGRAVVQEYNITPKNIPGFGTFGSIDNDYVFLSTLSSIEIYKRNNYDWNYDSSIINLSSTVPTNIKFKNNKGIISFTDGSAQIFENDGLGNYNSVLYLSGISNSSEGFGNSIAIGDYFAAISAPYKGCLYSSDGAVFVFTKNQNTNIWAYSILLSAGDNPDANFGSAISISDTTLAISRPGNTVSLNSNAGLIDIYQYSESSEKFISQKTYPPISLTPNVRLGKNLDLKGKILAARSTNGICIYNLNCEPAYIPAPVVPPCAIQLLSPIPISYIKKIDLSGYVLTIQCPKPPVVPLSSYCALVEIVDSNIPLFSINGLDILSPMLCPLTGV
jgi:hypothetical protein